MHIIVIALALCAESLLAIPIPMKLLRVPKIYNALITSNQRLLPSEAFPASTGPSFQPIGLSGDPVLLNPESLAKSATDDEAKPPAPLVFYPRYNVYHQLPQALFPYQQVFQPPPVVVPVQRSNPSDAPPVESPMIEEAPQPEEQPPAPQVPEQPAEPSGFVTNNRPENSDIPDVPPPPPPVSSGRSNVENKTN